MPSFPTVIAFGAVVLAMALTPGPNMIYLISRSLSQGPKAGLISLIGVGMGFVVYMVLAAFGITAIFVAVPYAYDALRLAGAGYLLYLAWGALKPGGRSPFQARELPKDPPRKLILMGLVTNLLNPKVAMLYMALLPQFVDPSRGSVLGQSLLLGSLQIVIGVSINGLVAATAGHISGFLAKSPRWLILQRWFMGTVLASLAVNMLRESRR